MTTYSTRDRRAKLAPRPFGLALDSDAKRLVKTVRGAGRTVDIVEDLLWFEREEPTGRYTLHITDHLGRTTTETYAAWGDAQTMAWHLTTPLPEPTPEERAWIANETFVRECLNTETPAPISGGAPTEFVPRPRRRFEPTQADRVWWAQQHTPEPEWDTLYAESLRAGDLHPDASGAFVGHDA